MLRVFFVVTAAILTCHAFPRYQRLRREAESASVESCKNAYDQCPDWKGQGMCSSDQYKDYMMTVCPVTCEFCKENHARDEIEVPEDSNEDNFYEAREVDESPEEQAGDVTSEDSDQSESSGSGSGNAEEESGSGSEELKEEEKAAPAKATAAKNKETKDNESSEKTSSTKATVEESKEENDSEAESGQSEESKEDEETSEEEDAKAVQPAKQAQSKTEGSITLLLRQRFEKAYEDPDSSPYKMLAGNVVTDFKNALKAKVTDISFSEGRVDGNPSQKGKTKVSFNFKGGNDQKIMKKLAKLVDEKQSINGLSVYANSLEFDE